MPMPKLNPLFWLILLLYLVAGSLYAYLTPSWQSPDEPAHYNYIRYLATHHQFPELVANCYDQAYLETLKAERFPPHSPIEPICYEYHQPPFYYVLATPIFWLTNGHLLALRLFSVALGGGTVALAYAAVQQVFPRQPTMSLGTMAVVACVPMQTAILASVNNDALASFMAALFLFWATAHFSENQPPKEQFTVLIGGLILGAALLTKLTIYITLPLAALTVWLSLPKSAWWLMVRRLTVTYGIALLLSLPWYIRNIIVYGNLDLLGLGRHDQIVVGQLRTTDYIAEVGWLAYLSNLGQTLFHSFWGQFGWMAVPMDGRVYWALTILMTTALVGWGLFLQGEYKALTKPQKNGLIVMMGMIALVVAAFGWYNSQFVQFQGRYLFTAMIPIGLLMTLGLQEMFEPRRQWILLSLLTLFCGWVVISGLQHGDVDSWRLLLSGLPFGFVTARLFMSYRYALTIPADWLLGVCYLGLAFLTVVSPFWFVLPHLAF